MQNILTVLTGYLGKISLPGLGVIDIIEIGLISFFVYQFMAWIKFTRAYTLLKGILVVLGFILKMCIRDRDKALRQQCLLMLLQCSDN